MSHINPVGGFDGLAASFGTESSLRRDPGEWPMLAHLGDERMEGQLDAIRRKALLADKQQIAEEARAWLEFSRATVRFQDRLKQGRNPGAR